VACSVRLEGEGDLKPVWNSLFMLVLYVYTLIPKAVGKLCLIWLGYTWIKWNKISIITDSRHIAVTAIWQSWGLHYAVVDTPFPRIRPLHCASHYPDIDLKRLRKTTKPRVIQAVVRHICFHKGRERCWYSEMQGFYKLTWNFLLLNLRVTYWV
jgi:hypothetical protein